MLTHEKGVNGVKEVKVSDQTRLYLTIPITCVEKVTVSKHGHGTSRQMSMDGRGSRPPLTSRVLRSTSCVR